MRKSVILKCCVGLLVIGLLCGCASMGKGGKDKKQISKVMEEWKAACMAKNVDGMLNVHSENFQNSEWGNKQRFGQFVGDAIKQGHLNGAVVDLEKAEITLDKGTATVYPVDLRASFGGATIQFSLAKEEGTWRIIGMDASD